MEPKTRMNKLPVWHHHHSSKMNLDEVCYSTKVVSVRIKGSATVMTVTSSWPSQGWIVEYAITHSPDENSSGAVWMSDSDLESAFDLSSSGKHEGLPAAPNNSAAQVGNQWLLDKYGGDVAVQGKFIRYGPCLNVPGPGTGNDGDPNISVYLTPEIKAAVKQLFNKF